MDLVCIVMYCQDTILKEVKGLTNKLYAYALARKKTGLPAKFQSHRCYIWLVRFAFSKEEKDEEEEEEEHGQSVKIVFTCISHLL